MFRRSTSEQQAETAASAGPAREVFRLVPPLVLWWGWLVFAIANVVGLAVQGASARFSIVLSAVLVAVTGVAYALTLRPKVVADRDGLLIVNPFRDHYVPWATIQAVDSAEWVQVHYAPDGTDGRGSSSASAKKIHCWALYVTARSRRRADRPPRQSLSLRRIGPLLGGSGPLAAEYPGRGSSVFATQPKLPEEARYLATLPPVKAIAAQLDKRASTARARDGQEQASPPTARWQWLPIAGVVVPVLAMLIIILL